MSSFKGRVTHVRNGYIVTSDGYNDVTNNITNDITNVYTTFPETHNAGSHNAIYRGKYLGDSVTEEQWATIKAGTFEELYIGDYWTINNVDWRIAAFDYYYGVNGCNVHHVTMVPDSGLYSGKMNSTAITTGGYVGSTMYISGLDNAKTIINSAFGSDHVLNHKVRLCNAVTNGYPSGTAWFNSTVELMDEHNVFGSNVVGDRMNGTTRPNTLIIDTTQFPLFFFNKNKIKSDQVYWLRNIGCASGFVVIDTNTTPNNQITSDGTYYVRPSFSIYSN